MNDAQQMAVQQWLNEHWLGQARCPAGHGEWAMAPNLSFMPGYIVGPEGPKIAHDAGFSFVLLSCRECGYVAFLDSETVGV